MWFRSPRYYFEIIQFFVFFAICVVYLIMKRLYYDSVKTDLGCIEEELEIEIEIHEKLFKETIIIDLSENFSNISYEDLHHENSTESSSNRCHCVYLNATDTNRFVH